MIETEFILGGFEAGLNGPSEPSDASELGEAHVGRCKHDVVGTLACVAQTATHQKPVIEALTWLLQPEQAHACPIIEARSLGAVSRGQALPVRWRNRVSDFRRRTGAERTGHETLVGTHRQHMRLLSLLEHDAQALI